MTKKNTRRRLIYASLATLMLGGILLPVLFNPAPAHAGWWWSSSWYARRVITFNNSASAENLINFPVRVSLTSSQIDYSKTQAAGQDIRFVNSDNVTPLSYEIEKWNATGTSEIWVRVPQIGLGSSTDFIYMYYGNAGASDAQDKNGVWNANTKGVWHLSEDPSGLAPQMKDSTATPSDGTSSNMVVGDQAAGQVSGSLGFNGSTKSVSMGTGAKLDPGGGNILTVEAWYKRATTSAGGTIAARGSIGTNGYALDLGVTCTANQFKVSKYGVLDICVGAAPADTNWHHLAIVWSGTGVVAYIDGVSSAPTSADTANFVSGPSTNFLVGTPGAFFNGRIDEVRSENVARSAAWIKAEYVTQSNTMNSFAAEELYPPEPPTLIAPLIIGTPLQPVFQLRSNDMHLPTYVRYKIDVCSVSDCSSILRTVDQTASQTGWSGQDSQTSTAYVASSTLTSSTIATYTYQAPALTLSTQYWWRAYAIDPGDSNVWSPVSAISTFTTQSIPSAPTLVAPISTGTSQVPMFQMRSSDADSDYLKYKFDLCTTSNCSSIALSLDQSNSQTGWSNQDASSSTAYTGSPSVGLSHIGSYQLPTPYLLPNTQYWWRAYAIDPGGFNTWSAASGIGTFTTGSSDVRINGGIKILGGTKL